MKDIVTGNKLVACPLGYYDVETQVFLVVDKDQNKPVAEDDAQILIVDYDDDIRDRENYEILYEFSVQDLADSISTHLKYASK
jgi:hypothetical protein